VDHGRFVWLCQHDSPRPKIRDGQKNQWPSKGLEINRIIA
jgi:hypothetical protein